MAERNDEPRLHLVAHALPLGRPVGPALDDGGVVDDVRLLRLGLLRRSIRLTEMLAVLPLGVGDVAALGPVVAWLYPRPGHGG